jgi:hypothetical protein
MSEQPKKDCFAITVLITMGQGHTCIQLSGSKQVEGIDQRHKYLQDEYGKTGHWMFVKELLQMARDGADEEIARIERDGA